MEITIEFARNKAVCKQDGKSVLSVPMNELVSALLDRGDQTAVPGLIPEGVRFVQRRADVVVLVVEEKPHLRTVQWLSDESPAPFGSRARYQTVRLSFPFVVLIIAFRDGELTGKQQCFYRTAPLKNLDAPLLLPNLYNVSVDAYDQKAWLCLKPLKGNLGHLEWEDKVHAIRKELWSKFNRSSEVHEGQSYWGQMRQVDPRVSNIEAWQEASKRDPFFPLQVRWKPAGYTVGQVVDGMLSELTPPFCPTSAEDLVQLFHACSDSGTGRKKVFQALLEALE
jgi:hypothetical protein